MVAMFTPHFNAFRFYDDDAGEAVSTQLAAEDTNININVSGGNISFQLRVRIDETGSADGSTMDDYQLDYDKNSGGFANLTTTDSGDGIHAVAAGLTNNNATTDRASDPISNPGAGSFVAGEQSDDGLIDDMQLTADNFTEHVYGIEIVAANVTDGDIFDFEFSTPGAIVNNVVPRITIIKTTGPDIAVPLMTYTLNDNNAPSVNIGVNIVPPTETYTLNKLIPIIGSGVSISIPLELYTLNEFIPIVLAEPIVITLMGAISEQAISQGPISGAFEPSGGVDIFSPLHTYTLNDNNIPLIFTGVNIKPPVELYTLNDNNIPTIQTGVNILVPTELFTLITQIPGISIGVNILVPTELFTLNDNNEPIIGIGVSIKPPLETFTLTPNIPVVTTGGVIILPAIISFILNDNNAPLISTGVNIKPPVELFTLNVLIPIVGSGVNIFSPTETFTLTNFVPLVSIGVNVKPPIEVYTLSEFIPELHAVFPIVRDVTELDLTPPFEDGGQLRYLFENFELIKLVLNEGFTGQFTTTDGKIVHVRNGVIIDMFT